MSWEEGLLDAIPKGRHVPRSEAVPGIGVEQKVNDQRPHSDEEEERRAGSARPNALGGYGAAVFGRRRACSAEGAEPRPGPSRGTAMWACRGGHRQGSLVFRQP